MQGKFLVLDHSTVMWVLMDECTVGRKSNRCKYFLFTLFLYVYTYFSLFLFCDACIYTKTFSLLLFLFVVVVVVVVYFYFNRYFIQTLTIKYVFKINELETKNNIADMKDPLRSIQMSSLSKWTSKVVRVICVKIARLCVAGCRLILNVSICTSLIRYLLWQVHRLKSHALLLFMAQFNAFGSFYIYLFSLLLLLLFIYFYFFFFRWYVYLTCTLFFFFFCCCFLPVIWRKTAQQIFFRSLHFLLVPFL